MITLDNLRQSVIAYQDKKAAVNAKKEALENEFSTFIVLVKDFMGMIKLPVLELGDKEFRIRVENGESQYSGKLTRSNIEFIYDKFYEFVKIHQEMLNNELKSL